MLLKMYPSSTMIGVDHSPKAIAIANAILPKTRSQVLVADKAALPSSFGTFDYIFAPGALCATTVPLGRSVNRSTNTCACCNQEEGSALLSCL